ncbi:hypothetical protein ACGFXC_01685 [Streptomyces sp. NPDC048507]|uniref:hypothetical protein n=1 Tax=Streptomyces sp. NPDC048507 TaxID=3365560 RepID=UPI00371F5E2A
MSETERTRPPAAAPCETPAPAAAPTGTTAGRAAPQPSALELLTSLVGGTDGPADVRSSPAAPARPDRLTDGVVELRKRGELAVRRAGADEGQCLEAMARRAAERAGRPHA